MSESNIQLESSWLQHLKNEFKKTYMQTLKQFLHSEKQNNKTIYPKGNEYFAALNTTPFEQVKVVILGQDPYHGPNQAHGMSFSVKPGVKPPPSLINIYKELHSDLGIPISSSGYLLPWAKQGVLLLNAVLSVEAKQAGSHRGKGWESFTDKIVQILNDKHDSLVFVLWGADAQRKGAIVDPQKHVIIKSPHPSPFSVYRGFFGSKPFSKINKVLTDNRKAPINWALE